MGGFCRSGKYMPFFQAPRRDTIGGMESRNGKFNKEWGNSRYRSIIPKIKSIPDGYILTALRGNAEACGMDTAVDR